MSNSSVQKLFREAYPSSEYYQEGKNRVTVDGVDFYLGKTLTISSRELKNFKYRENVWIVKLRDPKVFSDFIMISNRIFVAWISIDQIVAE